MHAGSPSILSCGEVLWDLFPSGARFGGAPANFACHAALLGGSVSMLTTVGIDPRGHEALSILESFGINTSLVQAVQDRPTGSVGVTLAAAGKPSFEIHTNSAWDHIAWTPQIESHIAAIDALYFGTLGQRGTASRAAILRAVASAKERGIPRILDVNLRQPFFDEALIRNSIALASVLKLSDDELGVVSCACGLKSFSAAADTLGALREQFSLDMVVMTRGADGAILVTHDSVIEQPGIPTVVRDTVGAGDAFTAALTLGILRGEPHQSLLAVACRIASAVCTHDGAVPTTSVRACGS